RWTTRSPTLWSLWLTCARALEHVGRDVGARHQENGMRARQKLAVQQRRGSGRARRLGDHVLHGSQMPDGGQHFVLRHEDDLVDQFTDRLNVLSLGRTG